MKKKVSIGIIGFGSIGERHFRNLLKLGYDPVVLSRRVDIKTTRLAKTFRSFKNQGPYDIIFICNETYKHKNSIFNAVKLNPSLIFVEKPLVKSLSDALWVEKLVKNKNIHIIVGYSRQFFKPYQKIREIIQSKKLGSVHYLRISVGQNLKDWRKRNYKNTYSSKKFQGGGVVLDLVHEINFASWALGEKLIKAASNVSKQSSLKIDCEDTAESIFKTKSGTVVSVHQDSVRIPGKWYCRIVGSKGTLRWDSFDKKIIISYSNKKKKVISVIDDWNNMFVREARFVLSLFNQKRKVSNIREAVEDMRIINEIKK